MGVLTARVGPVEAVCAALIVSSLDLCEAYLLVSVTG